MLRKSLILLAIGLMLAAPASARKYKGDDTMLVSPYVFVIDHQGRALTIHTEVPFSDVDRNSLELHCDGAITPYYVKSDLRGNLVAKFRAGDVASIVAPPGAELSLKGMYLDGTSFMLTAQIRVK